MVSTRAVFMLVALFLAMVMTISSAPVGDDELTTTSPVLDDLTTTVGEVLGTTGIPAVDTKRLLFADNTRVTIDENVKTDDLLNFGKDGDRPVLPPTAAPRLIRFTPAMETSAVTTPSE